MTNKEFEEKMKKILKDASEEYGYCSHRLLVSANPDILADVGSDEKGNLVIAHRSMPNIKIDDIISIKFRPNKTDERDRSFFRFYYGNDNWLDLHTFDAYVHYLELHISEIDYDSPIKSVEEMVSLLESMPEMIEQEIKAKADKQKASN